MRLPAQRSPPDMVAAEAADLAAGSVLARSAADTSAEAADFILPDEDSAVTQPIFIVEEPILPGQA